MNDLILFLLLQELLLDKRRRPAGAITPNAPEPPGPTPVSPSILTPLGPGVQAGGLGSIQRFGSLHPQGAFGPALPLGASPGMMPVYGSPELPGVGSVDPSIFQPQESFLGGPGQAFARPSLTTSRRSSSSVVAKGALGNTKGKTKQGSKGSAL